MISVLTLIFLNSGNPLSSPISQSVGFELIMKGRQLQTFVRKSHSLRRERPRILHPFHMGISDGFLLRKCSALGLTWGKVI